MSTRPRCCGPRSRGCRPWSMRRKADAPERWPAWRSLQASRPVLPPSPPRRRPTWRRPDDPGRTPPIHGHGPRPEAPQLPTILLRPADLRHRNVDADAGPGLATNDPRRVEPGHRAAGLAGRGAVCSGAGPGPLRRDNRGYLAQAKDGDLYLI